MWVKKEIITAFFFLAGVFLGEIFAFSQERDPFMPLVDFQGRLLIARDIEIEGLSLDGIIFSEDKPVAIISGEVLAEGQSIGKYRVLKVEKNKVTLEGRDEIYQLNLEVN